MLKFLIRHLGFGILLEIGNLDLVIWCITKRMIISNNINAIQKKLRPKAIPLLQI